MAAPQWKIDYGLEKYTFIAIIAHAWAGNRYKYKVLWSITMRKKGHPKLETVDKYWVYETGATVNDKDYGSHVCIEWNPSWIYEEDFQCDDNAKLLLRKYKRKHRLRS